MNRAVAERNLFNKKILSRENPFAQKEKFKFLSITQEKIFFKNSPFQNKKFLLV